MSKLYDVENHIYMYCIVYRSVIFYTSEKAYNQVDFYNLILSLVNQLINVDTYIRLFTYSMHSTRNALYKTSITYL